MIRLLQYATSFALVLTLAACGGGGVVQPIPDAPVTEGVPEVAVPTSQEVVRPIPDAPVTEYPGDYGVGTTWVFDHTLDGETVQNIGTIIDRVQHKGREVYVLSDAVANRDPGHPCDGANGSLRDVENDSFIACLKDGEILGSTTPYLGEHSWPLQIGKSWRTEYSWTDNVIHPDWSGPGWQEFRVVGWEVVMVPAGTFMAYKIVRTKASWETTSDDVAISWYSPEIPATIKSIFHRSPNDAYGGAQHMRELVDFDVK